MVASNITLLIKGMVSILYIRQQKIKSTKCMFIWMRDLPYLPYSMLAPMTSWMGMWMHVHDIKARNKHKTLI